MEINFTKGFGLVAIAVLLFYGVIQALNYFQTPSEVRELLLNLKKANEYETVEVEYHKILLKQIARNQELDELVVKKQGDITELCKLLADQGKLLITAHFDLKSLRDKQALQASVRGITPSSPVVSFTDVPLNAQIPVCFGPVNLTKNQTINPIVPVKKRENQ